LQRKFDVLIERDEDGYYVASIPQIPGCHTEARSLDEAIERIREAAELCLEVQGTPSPTRGCLNVFGNEAPFTGSCAGFPAFPGMPGCRFC
jgi:predicted RNase H-like HicB family nuclease